MALPDRQWGDNHRALCRRFRGRVPVHKRDAERFLCDLKDRLAAFSLDLHPEKTRLIEFGRFAMANRRARGERRPETFDFLGFTHYCRTTRKGRFGLGRKPIRKRVTRTLKRIEAELRRRMHDNVYEVAIWLGRVVGGWLRYYAVPTSARSLEDVRAPSQAAMAARLATPVAEGPHYLGQGRPAGNGLLASATDRAPMAEHALCRQSPEVGAGWFNDHVRICAGGVG